MKSAIRNLVVAGLAVAVAGIALAGGGPDKVLINRVTGGSLSVTNEMGRSGSWTLERVEFAVPTAVLTNVFQISVVREYDLPEVAVNSITTNTVLDADGTVETNVQRYAGGSVTFTNAITVATTTNDTSVQWYDYTTLGEGFVVRYGDVQTFTFTDTNAIDLIRVYCTDER